MSMKHLVGYLCLIIALFFTGYVVLAALGRPTDQLFTWMTLLISNAATGLFTLLKTNRVESKVDEVHKQVNGRMTELIQAKTLPEEENGRPSDSPTGS